MTSPTSESWIEHALNGVSTRLAHPFEDYKPGDTLAGEIVRMREASRGGHGKHLVVTVRAVAGSLRGEPVTPGDWYSVECWPSVLRDWLARDKPEPGDRAAFEYRGKRRGQLDFVAGVVRDPSLDW